VEKTLASLAMATALLLASACQGEEPNPPGPDAKSPDLSLARRTRMVETQIRARGVKDERVLQAMLRVPRHEFVPEDGKAFAYADRPLPIGYDQTISQPYIVAFMTEAVRVKPADKVLEIGTGSGYQAAVLAEIAREVYTVEIVEPLAARAAKDLSRLGYRNVQVLAADGFKGWPQHAPFEVIVVTCAPKEIPPPLLEQLADGGRLVIPVGDTPHQELLLVEKAGGETRRKSILPVLFVPMTGGGAEGLK